MPWNGADALPMNETTGKHYRGVNVPMLWASQSMQGFSGARWATFKQWKAAGANVRKGEKGTRIVFWSVSEKTDKATGKTDSFMWAKHSSVFNVEQVDGYDAPAAPVAAPGEPEANAHELADAFIGRQSNHEH